MADTPQTLALIVMAQEYRGDLVRQINRRATALRVLPIKRGSGPACSIALEADGLNAENYSEGADVTSYGSDAQGSGTHPWAMYRSTFRLTGLAGAVAASGSTPMGNRRLWARNMVNSSAKLASIINVGLHTGAGTGTLIQGFGNAIGDATNTYYTIDRSDAGNAYFRPYVADPGVPTAPTLKQIKDDLGLIYDASGEVPEIALVPTAVFNKIEALFEPNIRYVKEIVTARGPMVLESGYEGINIGGCNFLRDKDAAAGTIEYINSNYVEIEYLPPDIPGLEALMASVPADDGYGALPLGFVYEMLAKTGDSTKAMVKSYLQLKVSRPNACGMRKNVATT